MANIESGGRYGITGGAGNRYSGAYQFGPSEIRETALSLGENPPTRQQFLSDPAMQERYMATYTLSHHRYLMAKSAKYRGMSKEEQLAVLGYAHNQGAGWGGGNIVGATKWLETGQVGSDKFGTPGTRYYNAIRANQKKKATGGTDSDAYKAFRGNYDANIGKMDGGSAGATINNDRSANNSNVSVTAPVNVHVAKADDAPDATARAVGNAVSRGAHGAAKPSRMQGSAAA